MRKKSRIVKENKMYRALRRFVHKLTGKNAVIFFIVIFLICVVSICIGIYSHFFYRYAETDPLMLGIHIGSQKTAQEYAELKANFSKIFTNQLNVFKDSDEIKVDKIENGKALVYKGYSIKNEDENYYQVNIDLPIININNSKIKQINKEIKEEYYDKANNIMRTAKTHTVYKVSYVSYLNEGVLSIVIRETTKTGNKAETVVVRTFNYSIPDNKELSLNDLIKLKKTDKETVQKTIDKTIEDAYNNALAIEQEFGSTYKRDLKNEIYKVDNAISYFLTDQGYVYIIYAYGEYADTNEIDIVIF